MKTCLEDARIGGIAELLLDFFPWLDGQSAADFKVSEDAVFILPAPLLEIRIRAAGKSGATLDFGTPGLRGKPCPVRLDDAKDVIGSVSAFVGELLQSDEANAPTFKTLDIVSPVAVHSPRIQSWNVKHFTLGALVCVSPSANAFAPVFSVQAPRWLCGDARILFSHSRDLPRSESFPSSVAEACRLANPRIPPGGLEKPRSG